MASLLNTLSGEKPTFKYKNDHRYLSARSKQNQDREGDGSFHPSNSAPAACSSHADYVNQEKSKQVILPTSSEAEFFNNNNNNNNKRTVSNITSKDTLQYNQRINQISIGSRHMHTFESDGNEGSNLRPGLRDRDQNVKNALNFVGYISNSSKNIVLDDSPTPLSTDHFVGEIDRRCYQITRYVVLAWCVLTGASYYFYRDSLEYLSGMEQKAPTIACLFLGMSCLTTIIPVFLRGKKRSQSGVLVAAICVQFLAFFTDLLLAFMPVPIAKHPFSGSKVYILRWCEWTPLSFVMTFLTDCSKATIDNFPLKTGNSSRGDISHLLSALREHNVITPYSAKSDDKEKNGQRDSSREEKFDSDDELEAEQIEEKKKKEIKELMKERVGSQLYATYVLAWSQCLSTACGLFFPSLDNKYIHSIVMIISCVLFSMILFRTYERHHEVEEMKKNDTTTKSEEDVYKWAALSLHLQKTCAILWSILVASYFCYTYGPLLCPNWRIFKIFELTVTVECLIDVVYKAIYMLIIVDVHDMIFDPKARAGRRLEELEQMMGVVWENSSDVICISVKGMAGDVTTILSPTYLKLFSKRESILEDKVDKKEGFGPKVIAFDLPGDYFEGIQNTTDNQLKRRKYTPSLVYDVDFAKDQKKTSSSPKCNKEDLQSIAQLVVRSWKAKEEGHAMLVHRQQYIGQAVEAQAKILCEANISVMDENVLVIVVRDISERARRFEAEKRVISETTARRKDAAANRFTRHEVKNGLLAAIGLCDSLNEACGGGKLKGVMTSKVDSHSSMESEYYLGNTSISSPEVMRTKNISELGKILTEVLDTVMAEAMARDVIHEVYEPKMEEVNLSCTLETALNLASNEDRRKRFPIVTYPHPLPNFCSDSQLWKYIHRNAVSNACKYGKIGGKITTEVHWDEINRTIRMNVINLPGDGHASIVALGDEANEIIFSPRKRLQVHTNLDSVSHVSASHSAGDGAWIMTKCASTLGGKCRFKFEPDKTIFTFQCPGEVFDARNVQRWTEYEKFEIPSNVYGIGIDDSKVQRGLLFKFFGYLGIPKNRIQILGGEKSDITDFEDWAQNFIFNHPNDYFLFIVDENLIVSDEQTASSMRYSGSKAVSNLRSRLLPDQEKRLLALVRSANDSVSDIAIYNSRAHGHIPKAPVKEATCLETVAPLWMARFPKLVRYSSENLITSEKRHEKAENVEMINATWYQHVHEKKDQSASGQDIKNPNIKHRDSLSLVQEFQKTLQGRDNAVQAENDQEMNNASMVYEENQRENKRKRNAPENQSTGFELKRPKVESSFEEIDDDMQAAIFDHVYGIDNFSKMNEEELGSKWIIVRQKMHALKGDLLVLENPTKNVHVALELMEELRTSSRKDFRFKWEKIRSLLIK